MTSGVRPGALPLSYTHICCTGVGFAPTISVHARGEVSAGSSRALLIKLPVHGAGERARTVDLLITNQLLCQLSYTSIKRLPQDTRLS